MIVGQEINISFNISGGWTKFTTTAFVIIVQEVMLCYVNNSYHNRVKVVCD